MLIEANAIDDLLAEDEMLVPTFEDALLDTLINYRGKAQSTTHDGLNIRITIAPAPTTTEVHRNGNNGGGVTTA